MDVSYIFKLVRDILPIVDLYQMGVYLSRCGPFWNPKMVWTYPYIAQATFADLSGPHLHTVLKQSGHLALTEPNLPTAPEYRVHADTTTRLEGLP